MNWDLPTTRISCTVDDCGWYFDDAGPRVLGSYRVEGRDLDDCINKISRLHRQGVEAKLAEHMATHEPIEYLRTIQRLNARVAELEAMLAHAAPDYERKSRQWREAWADAMKMMTADALEWTDPKPPAADSAARP